MAYSSLSLTQFRSYTDYTIPLAPGVNIVVGPNGSGKTNLLEAVYVLSQGNSFRVSDKDLIQHGAHWLRLEGRYDEQQRIVTYSPDSVPSKQFSLDGVKRQRLSHHQRLPTVLFEPNELRLLNGPPQRRRDYLDTLIGRLWPAAARLRSQYDRALLQRNNMLRLAVNHQLAMLEDQLFVWDIKLSEYAASLAERRLELLKIWNSILSELYSQIARTETRLTATYKSETTPGDYKAHMLHQLHQRRKTDIARGFTSVGPHRDDLILQLNEADAATSASRGELRTIVLAMKMIELRLASELSDKRPVLLLDDVFSELDASRRQALAELARDFQTIITTTDADAVAQYFPRNYYEIRVKKGAASCQTISK